MKTTKQIEKASATPNGRLLAMLGGFRRLGGTCAPWALDNNEISAPSARRARVGLAALATTLAALAFTAAPALAAPETPVTREAKDVTGDAAKLNGELNPNATGTAGYEFTYNHEGLACEPGVTGTTTTLQGEKTGKGIEVSPEPVTSLEGNTTYTFCVVAVNSASETAVGQPQTFTTLPAPPQVEGSPTATSVTPFEEKLEATVNPENQPTTECKFEYHQGLEKYKTAPCSPPSVEGANPQTVTASPAKLEAGTMYHFRVTVKNATGENTSVEEEFTTPVAEAPKVEGESKSGVTPFAATLEATVNPEFQETTCTFEYSTVKATVEAGHGTPVGCPTKLGSGNAGVVTSVSLTGLTPKTPYYYRVVAENTAHEKAEGATEELETLPKEAPVVESESASAVTPFAATLNATVDPDYQATSCEFEYAALKATVEGGTGTKKACEPASLGEGGPGASASLALTGLESAKKYYFRVVVTNGTGTSKGTVAEPISEFTTETLKAPVIERESVAENEGRPTITPFAAKLEAQINPEYQKTQVAFEYASEESVVLEGKGTKVAGAEIPAGGAGAGTSVSLTGLTPKTAYYFRVIATNATGTTENTGAIQKFNTLPAEAPIVESESAQAITLKDASLEAQINPNYQETKYEFEYATKASGETLEGTIVKVPGGSIAAGATAKPAGPVDLGNLLTPGTSYFYRVIATNAAGTKDGPVEKFTTFTAAPAGTEAPWFHLSSGARPTYINPEAKTVAVGEVQELSLTLGEIFGKKEQAFVKLSLSAGKIGLGEFATEPLAAATHTSPLTAAGIKKALEKAAYGAGDVEVEEKTGAGTLAFKITDLNRGVAFPLRVEELPLGGTAEVKPITKASFEGPQIIATAVNVGDAGASECTKVTAGTGTYKNSACTEKAEPGEGSFARTQAPVKLTDNLPAHLKAVSAEAVAGTEGTYGPVVCSLAAAHRVECTLEHELPPFQGIELRVGVEVEPGASTGERNEVAVSGGGAPPLSASRPVTVSSSPAPFGVEDYELTPEEQGGAAGSQAGSHPFQLTTTFALNQTQATAPTQATTGHYETEPVAQAKDLNFRLPPGLVGNPHPFARCTLAQFDAQIVQCPADTVLGAAVVTFTEPGVLGTYTKTVPVYNLEPQEGEPARFGFRPTKETPVFLDTSVRTGENYAVTVTVRNITQIVGFVSNTVTLWGVPYAATHDNQRGDNCLAGAEGVTGPCKPLEAASPPPFLDLPGSCTNKPLETEVLASSWDEPSRQLPFAATEPMPQLDGCNALPFHGSISVTPDVQEASRPSGLTVDVHVPQSEALNAEGLAPTELKNITVTLPEGLDLNPSAADGLAACTQAEVGLDNGNEAQCPSASKIATVEIDTPLLPNPLTGFVYLASPQNFAGLPENPFSSLVAMYLVAFDKVSGTLIKLPGSVSLNQSTGQITSTFADNPQLPFEDAKLKFFGGERAPLSTPQHCGSYTTQALYEPWSAEPSDEAALRLHESSTFAITSGPGGSACPSSPLPFKATLAAGTTNNNAGGFTPLTTTLSRPDGDGPVQSVTLHMPDGLEGLLSGVKLCGEVEANAGTCGPESQIGETIVSVGVGGDPFTVTGGRAYITGPYHGAPFGLSIVNPAKAGPFDLQEGRPVVVRAKIEVDPQSAALTITTNSPSEGHAIPAVIEGFPLQIQHVNVLVNRPDFTFNPTNCDPQKLTGTISSSEGTSSLVEVPFQATNCAVLKYTPTLSVSTAGKASKANGASLFFKIAYPKGAVGTQSWMKEMKFDIPKQLPARLTTIQQACVAKVFETERQSCPPASVIGHLIVHTPVLPVPLEGPLYFVSYGGAAFPDAVAVLHGYGLTIESHGHTFINGKTGVTSATFEGVPDVPFESIEVTVPQGPFSEFGANLPHSSQNFCGQKLVMPILFKAQNGLEIHQNVPVGVTGCGKAKTRAQLLAAALKACHKKHGKKRASCEKAARRAYGAKKASKKGRK